jgi:hypothetical protein
MLPLMHCPIRLGYVTITKFELIYGEGGHRIFAHTHFISQA